MFCIYMALFLEKIISSLLLYCVQVNVFSMLIVYGKISNLMYTEKITGKSDWQLLSDLHSTTFLGEWSCLYTSHSNTSQVNLLLAGDGFAVRKIGQSHQWKNCNGPPPPCRDEKDFSFWQSLMQHYRHFRIDELYKGLVLKINRLKLFGK